MYPVHSFMLYFLRIIISTQLTDAVQYPIRVYVCVVVRNFCETLFEMKNTQSSIGLLILCLFVWNASCMHITEPDQSGVFVKRVGINRYFHLESNATLLTISSSSFSIMEVCSRNPPCHDSMEKSSHCNAITSTCNCLVWVGSIDWLNSTGLFIEQLSTERKACVRIAVSGNGTLLINWSMRTVGTVVPNMLRNVAYQLKQRSNMYQDMSLARFTELVLVPVICNKMQTSYGCISQTVLHIGHVKIDEYVTVPDAYVLVAVFLWLAILVFWFVFGSRMTSESRQKKTQ